METKLTNQDIIDLVEGSLPPERVEFVRAELARNPELAAKLRKLAADRGALRVLGGLDARQPVPAGLVDRAMAAAHRTGDPELKLVHAEAADARARHRRPRLAGYKWPAVIAAALTIAALAGWAVFILRATDPDARIRELAAHKPPEYIGSEPPATDSRAVVEGRLEDAIEGAGAREMDRRIDELVKVREDPSDEGAASVDAVIADLLNPQHAPAGVDVRVLVEQSGLTPIELGDALLDGRLRITLHTRSPARVLASAGRLDGAAGPVESPILVQGDTSVPDDADYAKGEPGASRQGADGSQFERTVAVTYGVPTDSAVAEAVAEFERLIGVLGEGCDGAEISVAPTGGGRGASPELDSDRAIWWDGGPSAWVSQATARFEVLVTDAPRPEAQGPTTPAS